MPGATPKGFTTPLDSDPVADLAGYVRQLAGEIDERVGKHASGKGTITMDGTAMTSVAVAFPSGRFDAVPNVVASVSSPDQPYYAQAVNADLSGFTLRCVNRDGTGTTEPVDVTWHAHQEAN